jgi:hypothetical protein
MDGKPIANKYYEGKMKRTLKRGSKDLKSLRRKLRKLAQVCEVWRKRWGMVFSKRPETGAEEGLSTPKTESGLLLRNGLKIFHFRVKLGL